MEDYKELILDLREKNFEKDESIFCTPFECGAFILCERAATVIETLIAERDATVEMLRGECRACKNNAGWHNIGKCATCKHEVVAFLPDERIKHNKDNWEWIGLKKDSEDG